MMNTIVDENLISFKELEQKIFNYVCELLLFRPTPAILVITLNLKIFL